MTDIDRDTMIELRAGPLWLVLTPSVGGTIRNFDRIEAGPTTPILRGCHTLPENALAAASFPLVPYVNRIRGGRFDFRGREVRIAPNMAGDPSPLHGQGWQSAWRVEQADARHCRLRFDHPAGEWPWAYSATQHFALDEDGLTLTLTCRNGDAQPMPCGLGQHPYFPCTSETRIDTIVTHAWTIDEHILPVERVPASGRFDLADRKVCGQDLDHGFGGWSGSTRLSDPAWPFTLTLSSPDARFFQLYSPTEGGLFVAEPVSHANAALNAPEAEWPQLGLRLLEPDQEMSLTMRLDVAAV